MVNGIYVAASSMASQAENLEAIAGNLANLSTAGYKRDVPAFSDLLKESLAPALTPTISDTGVVTIGDTTYPEIVQPIITVDLQDGSLRGTSNPFDLAVQGPGFLVVQTPEGEAYTRNGALTIKKDGYLATHNGYPVLGEGGTIRLNGTDWQVAANGEVTVEGAVAGRLRLVGIPAESVRRIGDSLVLSATEPTALDWADSQVKQGFLEQSNVNAIGEMISLIATMRIFEANQKVIQAEDETLSKAVNQVPQVL